MVFFVEEFINFFYLEVLCVLMILDFGMFVVKFLFVGEWRKLGFFVVGDFDKGDFDKCFIWG